MLQLYNQNNRDISNQLTHCASENPGAVCGAFVSAQEVEGVALQQDQVGGVACEQDIDALFTDLSQQVATEEQQVCKDKLSNVPYFILQLRCGWHCYGSKSVRQFNQWD